MVVKAEQECLKALITDTLSALCKNGLKYTKELCIEGLLGITIDQDEVFVVNIKEIVKPKPSAKEDESDSCSGSAGEDGEEMKPRKKKKRRHSSRVSDNVVVVDEETVVVVDKETNTSMAPANNSDNGEPANKSIKQEVEDDSGDDLVLVKVDKPSAKNSVGQTNSSQSQFPGADNSSILGNLSQHGQLNATPQSNLLPDPLRDPKVDKPIAKKSVRQTRFSQSQFPGADNSSILGNLSQHGQSYKTPQSDLTFGQYRCPYCNKLQWNNRNLKKHLKDSHACEGFRCVYCSANFEDLGQLEVHIVQKSTETGDYVHFKLTK